MHTVIRRSSLSFLELYFTLAIAEHRSFFIIPLRKWQVCDCSSSRPLKRSKKQSKTTPYLTFLRLLFSAYNTLDRLQGDARLHPGQRIYSPNRALELVMQEDGNLVCKKEFRIIGFCCAAADDRREVSIGSFSFVNSCRCSTVGKTYTHCGRRAPMDSVWARLLCKVIKTSHAVSFS